jgi:phosphoglucosamine mutase
MAQKKYFGTDGIRGKVGHGLISADWFLKLGWAVGMVLSAQHKGKVLIGKDTRRSGYMFESALEAGIIAAGMDVSMLGPMPTPGIAYLTRTLQADAGIVISASHNSHIDNGIKFFSTDGTKFSDDLEFAIEKYLEMPMKTVASKQMGRASRAKDAQGRYIEFCKSTFPSRFKLKGLKIVVDCANGAAYNIAPNVFQELGAEVFAIGVAPDGLNINENCGATSPQALAAKVVELKADVGIALDGDGDRLIMVDHTGAVVDGDEILLIIARWYLQTNKNIGGVAGTLMSNLGLELACNKLNLPFCRTKVGDRYVLEALQQREWLLGGEASGHILCLDAHSTGDGIIAALRVLAAMVSSGETLYEQKQFMQKHPQVLINVPLAKNIDLNSVEIKQAVAVTEAKLNKQGRVLLRASGTEPLIRVMVEGIDITLVNTLAKELADTVAAVACENT